jgi:hypothetical protein
MSWALGYVGLCVVVAGVIPCCARNLAVSPDPGFLVALLRASHHFVSGMTPTRQVV